MSHVRQVHRPVSVALRIKDAKYLIYANDHRISELDTGETYGDDLDRLGIPEHPRVTLEGFLELTMGRIEQFGATWIRAFLGEVLLKPDKLYVPVGGCRALSHGLADQCGDAIRVSTPIKRVIIESGVATPVGTHADRVEEDAVICAVTAAKALDIIPDLTPQDSPRTRQSEILEQYSRCSRSQPSSASPEWSVALYPEDDTPGLLDRTVNLPECALPDKSTLDLRVGRERARELLPLDDDEIKRQMLADARRNAPPWSKIPDDDEVIFTRVYRWHDAICMAQPGMFAATRDLRNQLNQDVKNLLFAGDYMSAPLVNGALASSIAAAEEVLGLVIVAVPP